ncbi:AAA family ATPase [Ruminococcus sp. Marseille-P6503]|uniref:AAA family ATPase n=1 Tax=Ruminococcus sp. Marseille-P6503 TaxID=2364796 RepID=UPI000F52457F|nr:AAA family ATPase [Ruminococcus sp. Marseille-P6503]
MTVKINSLEFENVKRIKAVQLEPSKEGLTVIGGKNRQGKTSVLDGIAWALGGDKYKPSEPKREGSVIDPHLKITLNNGIVVERSGKNGSLKVVDPAGNKGGQQLLNSFVEQFALDLPKFLNQSSRQKAETLLKIIGVGDKLYQLEAREQAVYNQRTAIGRIADQKDKYAKEMPVYTNIPSKPVSASELIRQQQTILAKNGENQRKRERCRALQAERDRLAAKVNDLSEELKKYQKMLAKAQEDMEIAFKTAEELVDENTSELESNIAQIEEINKKIRANLDREKAEIDAEDYKEQYRNLTDEIEKIRQAKRELLKDADLPLPGLSVENGELLYNGYKWDNMSGAEQLIVATSIVRKLNPECGFVLLDKLEQLDSDTLKEFGKWLEEQGLQAIATRVSTGDECSIIIEDGMSKEPEKINGFSSWNGGKFNV